MVLRLWWALSIIALSITHVSVSVANNFVRPQSSADYGYYAYGEVSHFVYCLLQKIKQSSVLPLVEKWEEYITPNHSRFAAIKEDRFLAGTRVLSALEKVGSSYLRKEFRRDCRNFLEDFVNCVLSTVAARSAIGQGLSCFCPPVLIGGMIMPLYSCLTCFSMVRSQKDGCEVEVWWLANRNTSLSCKSRGNWSGHPQGAALM